MRRLFNNDSTRARVLSVVSDMWLKEESLLFLFFNFGSLTLIYVLHQFLYYGPCLNSFVISLEWKIAIFQGKYFSWCLFNWEKEAFIFAFPWKSIHYWMFSIIFLLWRRLHLLHYMDHKKRDRVHAPVFQLDLKKKKNWRQNWF